MKSRAIQSSIVLYLCKKRGGERGNVCRKPPEHPSGTNGALLEAFQIDETRLISLFCQRMPQCSLDGIMEAYAR